MTEFSSRRGDIFFAAVFACCAAKLSVCVWVCTLLLCRSCGSCFICVETIRTRFLGHKFDFIVIFSGFYMVFCFT